MDSQTPVAFRQNRFKVGLLVFFSGLLLIFAIFFMARKWTWILVFLFFIFLTRGIAIMKKPYLFLSDHQLTVYRGFFLKPLTYHLNTVNYVHSHKPEVYIELLHEEAFPERKIKIDLRPLDRKDRIRFIFLLESHINRKKISKYTIGQEGV